MRMESICKAVLLETKVVSAADTGKSVRVTLEGKNGKAEAEYDRYRRLIDGEPRPVDKDFEEAIKKLPKLPRSRRKNASEDG